MNGSATIPTSGPVQAVAVRFANSLIHPRYINMLVPQQHGPWKILARKEVYRDPWIEVLRDEVVRPDGKPGSHCVVRLKPGVTVLPVDDQGTVYLTEEFHYGVGKVTLEAVSGGIEPDEEALTTGRRELREELGLAAATWHDLGVIDPFTANVVSPTRLFLATDLQVLESNPEGTERIQRVRLPLAKALAMVQDGRITHGPTCVNVLKTWLRTSSMH